MEEKDGLKTHSEIVTKLLTVSMSSNMGHVWQNDLRTLEQYSGIPRATFELTEEYHSIARVHPSSFAEHVQKKQI